MKGYKLSLMAALIAGYAVNPIANAQTPALEEVLVTSQKRVQSIQDVPISVNAISGDKIEKDGITSIERMADYIPSFNMTQTGIGTNISIRGITSGVNQGFEQSAAQFVDGVHFGRAQLARAPFLDIERVEVLRGPQSILFGKNSTAGAISISTAKPTDEFEAKLTALYEPEHSEEDVRFVISGPLTDTLSGRIAIMDRTIDGYFENTTLGRDESSDEERVIRGTLNWKPNDAWDITLKMEDGSFNSDGRNIDVVQPVEEAGNNAAIPYADVLLALTGGSYVLDTQEDFNRQSNGDYSYNETNNTTLTIETDLGEHTLTSVTGYNAYNYQELCDCDFIGLPIFDVTSDEDYSQLSQELRIASPTDGELSYLGGVFFQTSELQFDDVIGVPTDSILGIAVNPAIQGAASNRNFEQDSDLAAVFAQVTWNITDMLHLTVGGRYSEEEKEASRGQTHVAPNGTVLPVGTPAAPYNGLFGLFNIEPYETIYGDRSESSFTPQINLQYDLNGTDMLYISYTEGFKSGGFDVRANAHPDPLVNNSLNATPVLIDHDNNPATPPIPAPPAGITGTYEFEDEKATNYEIGGKFSLADGAAEVNVALFRSEFDDMQTSQFDGGVSFNVTNAAEAVVQGLEIDGRWAILDSLLVRGGAAYLDFEYENFPNSQCYFDQTDNIAPFNDNFCDASGQRREFTPEVQGNIGFDHTLAFGSFELSSTLDVIYSDEYLTTPSLDPKLIQEEFVKINARIALSDADQTWEIALVGKNLTDEKIITYANGLPVASILTGGTGTGYYAFYERPRTIALQGTLRF